MLAGLVFMYKWKYGAELGRWSEGMGDEGAVFCRNDTGLKFGWNVVS